MLVYHFKPLPSFSLPACGLFLNLDSSLNRSRAPVELTTPSLDLEALTRVLHQVVNSCHFFKVTVGAFHGLTPHVVLYVN